MAKQQFPPDTPQVQVEVDTAFGGKQQQQVAVQTNRIDPKERFIWKWLNWLYPPANPADFALDAGSYVLGAGFVASVGKQWLWVASIPTTLVLLLTVATCLMILCWFVSKTVEQGWILLGYRLLLVVFGVVLGGVL